MTARTLTTLIHEGPISTLTIARPEKLNALNAAVIAEIASAAAEVAKRDDTRVLLITGAGEKSFVAGADIAEMESMTVEQARAFAKAGHDAVGALELLEVPVIAVVNGFALGGGCELALACDFIYASDKARFGQPEVKLGVIPGFGGTQRLARRVGIAMARELVMSGAMIEASEALRIGLVNRVFPAAELHTKARETATTIAAMGPLAVAHAKRVLREGAGKELVVANQLEVDGFARCFATGDQKEGMAAFLGKRTAHFTKR